MIRPFGLGALHAAEKVSLREINGIIRDILDETVEAKKEEYAKRLRA